MILRDKKQSQSNITKGLDEIISMLHKGTFSDYCRTKDTKYKDLLSILKTKAKTPEGLTVKSVIQSNGSGIPLLNGFYQSNQRRR